MGKCRIQLQVMMWRKISAKAKRSSGMGTFGISNIFRVFIGDNADGLLEENSGQRNHLCGDL